VPRAGRLCFAIAFVNAAIWGVVTPPFQVPDEITHFAYVQYLAEEGQPPPQGPQGQFSPQEQETLSALHFFDVIGRPQIRGIFTAYEDRMLRRELASRLSPVGPGGTTSASNQPPLYYTLEAVPYLLSPSSDILTRLGLMRLLSALIAAGTVLVIFMFLRELFPRSPWAWTVGALAVAFQPTFAFIAGSVQGDNLLFFASALIVFLLLRTYRRGLTMRRGAVLGAAVAIGALSKLTFLALLPGIALALGVIAWRSPSTDRKRTLAAVAGALVVAATPLLVYAWMNVSVWHRGGITAGGVSVAANTPLPGGAVVTIKETIDYIWELFLPPLGFIHHVYFVKNPLWEVWFNGSIGHFGWLDYMFPLWVYTDARYLLYVLLALAAVCLVRARARIPPLLPLFACYGAMALGLFGAIGYAGIRYKLSTGYTFEQARYLFPLLSFYAVFLVLAARGAGRRWAPVVGGALVALAMIHGLFAETLTISRYYG
jgi:predicted membrane protein DUF2142